MAETPRNDGWESKIRRMERDDRGVFGPEGIDGLSASVRRRFVTAMQPARTRAFILLKQGKLDEADGLLRQSLPRHEADCEDDRYFGIYCGLADVAWAKGDSLAALDWFRQGIEKFPSAIRQNHIAQLAKLGVDVSRWIRSKRDDGMSESDAAGVLSKVIDAMRGHATATHAVREQGKAIEEFGRLEGGTGNEARSRIRSYLD